MRIRKAEFVKSAAVPEEYPKDELPQMILAGRSNVGKSSFLNCLANNKRLARVSRQPGKTRLINFYKINNSFYIVDLPGYGFARVSKKEQKRWGDMIDTYLSRVSNLFLILQLVDIRHEPGRDDIQMMEWIRYFNLPVAVVATKADKLGKSRWKGRLDKIRQILDLPESIPVVPFSACEGTGKEEVLSLIEGYYRKLKGAER